jgi:predicted PurR-regulated permease PerM
MPRPLAIGLAYFIGVSVVLGFGAYIIVTAAIQISTLVTNLPTYAQQAQSLMPRVEALLVPFGVGPDAIANVQRQLVDQLQTAGTTVARDSLSQIAGFFGTIIDVVLVLILSIYLAADGTRIAQWLKTQTPGRRTRARASLLVAVISRVVGGYIRGVLTLAVLVGVLVGGGLAALGVPYAVLLGVLAFFMEFVPVLGVFVSGAASLGIAIFSFQDLLHPLLVLAYFAFVHVIEGDVVGPRIMGKAVGIHPATGLIALVAGSELFGVWGTLFAAPLAGLVQAIVMAAWLEFRGGAPEEVFQAVVQQTAEKADEHARGVASGAQ